MNKKPNIILLMTDQLRGDALGYAGHPDVKTPYLDTLASQGVNFDRAYSACPSCIARRGVSSSLATPLTPSVPNILDINSLLLLPPNAAFRFYRLIRRRPEPSPALSWSAGSRR